MKTANQPVPHNQGASLNCYNFQKQKLFLCPKFKSAADTGTEHHISAQLVANGRWEESSLTLWLQFRRCLLSPPLVFPPLVFPLSRLSPSRLHLLSSPSSRLSPPRNPPGNQTCQPPPEECGAFIPPTEDPTTPYSFFFDSTIPTSSFVYIFPVHSPPPYSFSNIIPIHSYISPFIPLYFDRFVPIYFPISQAPVKFFPFPNQIRWICKRSFTIVMSGRWLRLPLLASLRCRFGDKNIQRYPLPDIKNFGYMKARWGYHMLKQCTGSEGDNVLKYTVVNVASYH